MLTNLRLESHPILDKGPTFPRTVHITVNGFSMEVSEGESLAAALWANGILALRNDEKTNDPRGMYCGIGHCFECRAIVDGVADVRSCMTPVREGMRVSLPEGIEGRKKDGER